MKKICVFVLLLILIPYFVVTLFIADEEVKFFFKKEEDRQIRIKQSTGQIVSLPFEEYITGVLAGEMPIDFELEALKAQAVAARSYALVQMSKSTSKDYDVVDTVMNQVYLDENTLKQKWGDSYLNKISKVRTAVAQTKGEYLDYNGTIVEAFFFSTSSGKTENVEEVFSEKLPYLRSVDSSFDAEVSPVFSTNTKYTVEEFCNKLGVTFKNPIEVEIQSTTSTGRIKKIKINGKSFTGNDAAYKLNLRSSFFSLKEENNIIYIATKGFGHGVGMSQYGAEALAKKGYRYDTILKHYYTNIQIKNI